MKVQVAPFWVPDEGAVRHNGWLIAQGPDRVHLPSQLKPWDYQTDLHLSTKLLVDRAAILTQAHLGAASAFEILVMVRSNTTKVERNVLRLGLPDADTFELRCDFVLQGQDMGGRLTIETVLVAKVSDPLDSLAPVDVGSVLWRHKQSTYVEGLEGQFPTDAEDFGLTFPDSAHAGWVLRVDSSDTDALFMSSVRLTLNSGLPAVQRLLQGATDPATVLLAAALDVDMTRQLVNFGLQTEEVYLRDVDHESRTLAGVVRSLIAQLWPSVSPLTLRTWMTDTPERIERHIQSVRRFPS